MALITPVPGSGLLPIYHLLGFVFLPPLATHAVLKAWESYGHRVPFGLYLLAYIISCPILFYLQQTWNNVSDRLAAARMGAVLAPNVELSPWSIYRRRYSQKDSPPYLAEALVKWAKKYGNTYGFTIARYRMVTLEPEHVKAIVATQFEEFEKSFEVFDRFYSLLGSGIFNTDGDTWKFHRSMARPFFNKDRISDFEAFGKHADEAIAAITERLSEGQPVEIADVAARFTLDTATEFLFGKSVESMAAGLEYPASSGIPNPPSFNNHPSNAFVKAFADGQKTVSRRNRLSPFWRLEEPWADAVRPYREEVNKYIDPIIKEGLAQKSVENAEHESLLSSLVAQTQDYKVIQDQLINILVAGRDTTANTLMFAVYMLTQHPDITRRLREEIIAHVGEMRAPTYDDFRDMKYLRAFLNETLRLYPIVPVNARTSKVATTLPSATPGGQPIYVPKNTVCLYSVFWMHRRTDLWGPDAEEFDPDRFIDDRLHKYLTPNPFIFLPFNGGPRICLGQQFAYNEMSYFLVRLLQRFTGFSIALDAQPKSSLAPESWRGSPGTKGKDKIRIDVSLTMFAREGLWVRMEKAK